MAGVAPEYSTSVGRVTSLGVFLVNLGDSIQYGSLACEVLEDMELGTPPMN
jgi:hypothetical protein